MGIVPVRVSYLRIVGEAGATAGEVLVGSAESVA